MEQAGHLRRPMCSTAGVAMWWWASVVACVWLWRCTNCTAASNGRKLVVHLDHKHRLKMLLREQLQPNRGSELLKHRREVQVGAQAEERAGRRGGSERAEVGGGQELAEEQVGVMRELQSQLRPVMPSWSGDPRTECCRNEWQGVQCNSEGEVVEMRWGLFSTYSPFPTAVGALASLTHLSLGNVAFTNSSLPSQLGRLTNLQALQLQNCSFLTTQLQDLTWLSSLGSLRSLRLCNTGMRGAVPDGVFPHLTHLTSVALVQNSLALIPYGVEALNASLLELTVAQADVYDFLPPRLFALSRLTWLDLSHNRLQGGLSEEGLASLVSLRHLDLGYNELTGRIPGTIGRLQNLTRLVVRSNGLTGWLPSELFALPSLQYVRADNNRLMGPFPETIGPSSASLVALFLDSNDFSGPLPQSMGLFTRLTTLALPHNRFSGSLPLAWTTLSALAYLNVTNNQLDGSPLPLLTRLTRLGSVDIAFNQFGGELSDTTKLTGLFYLSVKRNNFSGAFPIALLKLRDTIDISYNYFSGTIPEEVSAWPGYWLSLNNNNFSGSLPSSFSSMSNLQGLDFSHNRLSGSIPSFLFARLHGLQLFDLSYNNISGGLPSFSALTKLSYLSVRRNLFSGSLTGDFFREVRSAGFVDLAHNALGGSLSEALSTVSARGSSHGEFQYLFGYVYLDSNLLSGSVPSSICSWADLKAFSLANNLLSGEIPPCLFSRPGSLQWLDLSNNALFGQLQSFDQPGITLALANNFLYGDPDLVVARAQACNLKALRGEEPMLSHFNVDNTFVENNCLTLDEEDTAPSNRSASGGGCVLKEGQRTSLECGRFCGSVGGGQCGGNGVCQTAPMSSLWAAQPRANNTDTASSLGEAVNNHGSMMDSVRRSLRGALISSATCQCIEDFAQMTAKNGTVTCERITPPPPPPTPPSIDDSRSSLPTGLTVGIAVAVAAMICAMVVTGILVFLLRPRRHRKWKDLDVCRQFSAAEITRATQGWSDGNLLGQGAFGAVYRGVSPEGEVWAVKRATLMSNDFETEVRAMASLNHPRLVRLLGFCEELNESLGSHEQILVYEFVPGGDLKERMHGPTGKHPPLSMAQRLDIVAGTAEGLAYLHSFDPPIVHRDIKPANILIDDNLQPKIADFGLLKQLSCAHDATRVAGTPGYVDPDYNRSNTLSVASDVFSLGVVILEMVSGRAAVNPKVQEGHVLRWARPLFEAGDADGLRDPAMLAPDEAVLEFALLAMDCTRCPAMFRPTMKDVVSRSLTIKAKHTGRIEEVSKHSTVAGDPAGGGWSIPRNSSESSRGTGGAAVESRASTSFPATNMGRD